MIPINLLIKYQMAFEGETTEEVKERYGDEFYSVFLIQTDHIPNKILEGVATSEEYADELYYREVARQELDKLNGGTGEVSNAVPLDVLLSTLLGVE